MLNFDPDLPSTPDFVLSPLQAQIDARLPRTIEIGPRPRGLHDWKDLALNPSNHLTPAHKAEEETLLDVFASTVFAKLIGAVTHSDLLDVITDVGLEGMHAAEELEEHALAARRTASGQDVRAVNLDAQLDPALVFRPNGQRAPSLDTIAQRLISRRTPNANATSTRPTVRSFGRR